MKITITIETERPFCGNEVTLEDFERDQARRNHRNRMEDPDWAAPNLEDYFEKCRRFQQKPGV